MRGVIRYNHRGHLFSSEMTDAIDKFEDLVPAFREIAGHMPFHLLFIQIVDPDHHSGFFYIAKTWV
jgi:hypothetical protein